jgi:hypothetical protein
MEGSNNVEQIVPKKRSKKFFWIILLGAIFASAAYVVYNLYLKPDNFLRQIYLVPKDAIFIIETDDPVKNWHKFSESKPWQYLKEQRKMEEINREANKLDSVLHANKTLLDILGKRNLVIAACMTRKSDYDYLFIVDIQKTSKLESLKSQLENLFKANDFQVTQRKFKGEHIQELYNPVDRSTLYLAIVENQLICSYTGLLVEKAIIEKDDPFIGRDLYFLDVEQKTPGGGLCRIYINYRYLESYLTLLTGVSDPDIRNIYQPLSYTGLQFKVSDNMLSLKGYTSLNDSTEDSYLPALLRSGSHPVTIQKVLSHRTACYVDMGFDDPIKFIDNVENVLQKDKEGYNAFKKNWDLIEKKLKIDIRENFLSWMSGEVAFAQYTSGPLDKQNEFVAVVKIGNKKDAVKNLNIIEESIRKNTPVKFKTIEYEGYEIHFLEMKGFFRLLFGKMFDKLNKPYYTIIDDYAVFSNSTATLLSMIEDYRLEQTLEKDSDFEQFMREFNNRSTVFVYANTRKFSPLARNFVSASTWKDLQANQDFVLCFPQTGFQLTGEKEMFDTRWFAEFDVPQAEKESDDEDEEIEMETEPVDFVDREDVLPDLERFYLEKFQGNVYTEFYDDGGIKSKSEMSKGVKDGKYQAFFPDGKLQVDGKFKSNQKTGVWKYFDKDGKTVRKEKWKNGKLKK